MCWTQKNIDCCHSEIAEHIIIYILIIKVVMILSFDTASITTNLTHKFPSFAKQALLILVMDDSWNMPQKITHRNWIIFMSYIAFLTRMRYTMIRCAHASTMGIMSKNIAHIPHPLLHSLLIVNQTFQSWFGLILFRIWIPWKKLYALTKTKSKY